MIGEKLSHYRILAELGRGGMGVVYRAHDERLDRDVALKLLHDGGLAELSWRTRLLREARLAASLNHPNICTVHEVGETEGHVYVVMEYVDGTTLKDLIRPGGLATEATLRYGMQIADALAHSHERGVLHRDLKPANVVVAHGGRIKVLDFGLAKSIAHRVEGPSSIPTTLTAPGTVVGTPAYMAPEVLSGAEPGARSDLWSLGVVLYELATGVPPFAGRTTADRWSAILRDLPLPLPTYVPPALRAIIMRCLAKEPEHRYRTAMEVRAALEALLPEAEPRVSKHRRQKLRTPILVAMALLAVLPLALLRGQWRRLWRPTPEYHERQVTSFPWGSSIVASAISPDGRLLAYADTTGYYLRSLDGGEVHPLPGAETVPHLTDSWLSLGTLLWFPDGNRLLVETPSDSGMSLWTVSMLGSPARCLVENASEVTISPDGERIAFIRSREIWIMGSRGENPYRVERGSRFRVEFLVWSPHGDRLAFLAVSADRDSLAGRVRYSDRKEIATCGLDGKQGTVIIPERRFPTFAWSRHEILWLRDGRMLYCQRDSALGTDVLWQVDVDASGEARSSPIQIASWSGVTATDLSASQDGSRIALLKLRAQLDICVAELLDGGKRLSLPRRLTLDDHNDYHPRWTADSRTLLFVSDRNGSSELFQQRIDAHLGQPLGTGSTGDIFAVSGDDRVVYFEAEQKTGLTVLSLNGSPSQRVSLPESLYAHYEPLCGSRPGAPCVALLTRGHDYVVHQMDSRSWALQHELARIRLTTYPSGYGLSHDGRLFAISEDSHGTHVIDLQSRKERRWIVPGWEDATFASWAADGGAWFTACSDQGRCKLLHVDIDGPARLLGELNLEVSLDASPDGNYLAFDTRSREANVWLVERTP